MLGHGLGRERQMMRRRLRGDAGPGGARRPHRRDGARRADVRDVEVRAGRGRERAVTLDHHALGARRHPRQPEPLGDRTGMHDAAAGERPILGVRDHRRPDAASFRQARGA